MHNFQAPPSCLRNLLAHSQPSIVVVVDAGDDDVATPHHSNTYTHIIGHLFPNQYSSRNQKRSERAPNTNNATSKYTQRRQNKALPSPLLMSHGQSGKKLPQQRLRVSIYIHIPTLYTRYIRYYAGMFVFGGRAMRRVRKKERRYILCIT